MKITSLELIPIKTTREMGVSSPSDPTRVISHHVIVLLHTDEGITGTGEMSDVPFKVSRKLVADLQAKLEPLVVGKEAFEMTKIQTALVAHPWDHQVTAGID